MSLYQLNKAVYEYLRAAGTATGASARPVPEAGGYELTAEEAAAFSGADIRALYQLGLHPVLVNAFARAMGYQRTDYAKLLQDLDTDPEMSPRWRN